MPQVILCLVLGGSGNHGGALPGNVFFDTNGVSLQSNGLDKHTEKSILFLLKLTFEISALYFGLSAFSSKKLKETKKHRNNFWVNRLKKLLPSGLMLEELINIKFRI